jgi:transcriptional regulator with XRE-family HTH domain
VVRTTLEKNLIYYAQLNGLTLKELAQRAGISESTLHNLKRGETGKDALKSVQALANVMNISVGDLLVEKPPIHFAPGWNENIKFYRKKRGLTQGEMGSELGYSRFTVAKWESGEEKPSVGQCEAISRVLQVRVDLIFSGTATEAGPSFEDTIALLMHEYNKLKGELEAMKSNKVIDMPPAITPFERQVIDYIRSLSETDKLLKMYGLTSDPRYLAQYRSLEQNSPTSDQVVSGSVDSVDSHTKKPRQES